MAPTAPGVGLAYRPLSAGRATAASGLQGLGALLMALGSGQPQNAAAAFQTGLQGADEAEWRRQQQARDDELFGMQRAKFDLDVREKEREAAELAKQEELINSLDLPEDQKTLLRTGLAKYSDLNPKDDWEIKTIREGNQDVTYRINTLTGEREQLGSGLAFKPGSDGTNLSIAAPVWGIDKDGNPVLLQMSQSGVAVQTQLPEGITPVRPNVQVDTGTGTAMVSPITGQATAVVAKDVAGKQAAEEIGTATGKVAAGLPDAIAKAEEAQSLIESLKSHPGRTLATGTSSLLPTIPGTAVADFQAQLDQLKGTVFLQAYSQLRGGGAITEIEGQKAEQAIARLNTAQSEEAFVKALDDLKSVIAGGIERMKQRSGGLTPAGAAPTRVKVDAEGNVIGN